MLAYLFDKRNIEKNNKILYKKCSLQEKYGVSNVFQLDKVKEKIRKTNLKKYGFETILQDKKRMKQAMIKKYGVDHCTKIKDVIDKLKNKKFDKEYRKKISLGLIKAHKDSNKYKNFVNKGGKSKWYTFIDRNNKKHKCQGTYELRFAKILDNLKLNWKSFHKQLKLSNGKKYAPDFIINNSIYVDTKADYFYTMQKEKIDIAMKEINLILILTDDLNRIENNQKLLLEKL